MKNNQLQERTIKNQELVIQQFKKIPIIQVVCEKIGISRSTYYRWREKDKSFTKQADKALNQGLGFINDMAESQLINAIRNQNLTAVFYWLNHRHSAYNNKVEITTKIKDESLTEDQQKLIIKALEHASLIGKGGQNDNNK